MHDHTIHVGTTVVIDSPIDSTLDEFESLDGKYASVVAVTERDGERLVEVRLASGRRVELPADRVVPV